MRPDWLLGIILCSLILLAWLVSYPAWGSVLLLVIIIISGVISHAPGKLRYYSLYHRRVINSSNDAKG